MGKRNYPRLGGVHPAHNRTAMPKQMNCALCGKPCARKDMKVIEVQVSYFRGDDECFFVCDPCTHPFTDRCSLSKDEYEQLLGEQR